MLIVHHRETGSEGSGGGGVDTSKVTSLPIAASNKRLDIFYITWYTSLMIKDDLEKMYIVEHKTMQQIADAFGMTRAGVFYWVHKYGIDVGSAERFDTVCDICGETFSITRKRYVRSVKHYCKMECYKKHLRNPDYRQWRTGQRIGRRVMAEKIGRMLLQGEVVHHIDGDNRNNDPGNLMLFANHSEHLKYHHGRKQEKI